MRPAVTTTPRLLGALGLTVLVSAPLVAQPAASGPPPTVAAVRARVAPRLDGRLDDAIYAETPADQRLRAAGAVRVRAGHREDRGLDLLRRRQHLRVGPLLREPARAPRRQRDAARHQPAAPERHLRGAVRHLPRPPQRLHLLRQRRSAASRDSQVTDEGPPNVDWNTVWTVRTAQLRGRLDDRDGDSRSSRCATARPRADLGHQPAARRALEERVVVPRPRAARADDLPRHPQGLVRAARSSAWKRRPAAATSSSSRTRLGALTHRPDRGRRPSRTTSTADVGGRRQVRADPEPHRRLRRSTPTSPRSRWTKQQVNLTRFNLFFPEKRDFFLEGERHLRVRRPGQRRARRRQRRHAVPLLQPAHRPRRRARGSDARRRAAHRQESAAPRSAPSTSRPATDDARSVESTNFTVLRVKRDILSRSAVGAMYTHRTATPGRPGSNDGAGVDASFGFFQNLRVDSYLAATRSEDADGDNLELPRLLRLQRRSLRRATRAARGRDRLPAGDRVPAPHRLPPQLHPGHASARGRATSPRSASSPPRPA